MCNRKTADSGCGISQYFKFHVKTTPFHFSPSHYTLAIREKAGSLSYAYVKKVSGIYFETKPDWSGVLTLLHPLPNFNGIVRGELNLDMLFLLKVMDKTIGWISRLE